MLKTKIEMDRKRGEKQKMKKLSKIAILLLILSIVSMSLFMYTHSAVHLIFEMESFGVIAAVLCLTQKNQA